MARSDLRSRARTTRVRLAMAIAVALPALVACNSIIGLSDFEKGQCAGARCTDDGGLPDQVVEGGTDGSRDAAPDVRGADPVSWAQWVMPNYGPNDAGLPISSPPLVANGDGTVTDTVTMLVWRSTLAPSDPTAGQVQGVCAALPNGPWRAPKRIELVSLLDYSQKSPFIDRTKFTDINNFRVWTTSEVRPFVVGKPDQAYWVVNFETGAVEPLEGDKAAKALCVRAKQ
jgi:hypothetical protein